MQKDDRASSINNFTRAAAVSSAVHVGQCIFVRHDTQQNGIQRNDTPHKKLSSIFG
jgi:hypothetical protein